MSRKTFGFCEAGCKIEVVPREEFEEYKENGSGTSTVVLKHFNQSNEIYNADGSVGVQLFNWEDYLVKNLIGVSGILSIEVCPEPILFPDTKYTFNNIPFSTIPYDYSNQNSQVKSRINLKSQAPENDAENPNIITLEIGFDLVNRNKGYVDVEGIVTNLYIGKDDVMDLSNVQYTITLNKLHCIFK